MKLEVDGLTPVASAILLRLSWSSWGLTRSEITGGFSRHKLKVEIDSALNELLRAGFVYSEDCQTGGRPAEVWHSIFILLEV